MKNENIRQIFRLKTPKRPYASPKDGSIFPQTEKNFAGRVPGGNIEGGFGNLAPSICNFYWARPLPLWGGAQTLAGAKGVG